jgi:hypothetical protein
MGTVWMAPHTEPVKRPVALRLTKAGMASFPPGHARLEVERHQAYRKFHRTR